ALVRWHHPMTGLVPPGEFIGLAEESGAIVEVDAWVVRRALEQLAAWSAKGWEGYVAVNASVRTLRDPRYVKVVQEALVITGIAPERLVVEVTESAA
ncbi:MAG: EAL domain-containing protein, partial [Myxococcales bacterium]|nr:EAL domain-containing protein [Myxococcales bacterium]